MAAASLLPRSEYKQFLLFVIIFWLQYNCLDQGTSMHAALMNCRRVMTLLACAMKPEHLGGCSQSVHSGVAPDCSERGIQVVTVNRVYMAMCHYKLAFQTRTPWRLLSKCALWGCSRLLGGNFLQLPSSLGVRPKWINVNFAKLGPRCPTQQIPLCPSGRPSKGTSLQLRPNPSHHIRSRGPAMFWSSCHMQLS